MPAEVEFALPRQPERGLDSRSTPVTRLVHVAFCGCVSQQNRRGRTRARAGRRPWRRAGHPGQLRHRAGRYCQRGRGVPAFGHVFVIIGENTTYSHLTPTNAPYLMGTIRPHAAWLTNYYAATHWSQANYVAMVTGDDGEANCKPVNNRYTQFDDFLAAEVPKIEASPAFGATGVIIVVYDEDERAGGLASKNGFGSGGHVACDPQPARRARLLHPQVLPLQPVAHPRRRIPAQPVPRQRQRRHPTGDPRRLTLTVGRFLNCDTSYG